MTKNLAPKGFDAWQMRQIAIQHERLRADNGIMTPIIAETLRPEVQARNKNGRVKPVGELLDAAKERLGVCQRGDGLNEADVRVGLH